VRPLNPGDVHVWSVRLRQPAVQLSMASQTLSADELARAQRFRFERDRDAFIAARGALRAIVGRYLDLDPASLEFSYGPHGKPALTGATADLGLNFNLSHSHTDALVALTHGRPVGVDLEYVLPFEGVDDFPTRIFSARELTEFQALPLSQRDLAFYSAWTRKEAFIKATGLGFSMSAAEVEVTFSPGEPAQLISLQGSREAAARWTMCNLTGPRGYAAAVVVQDGIGRIRRFRLPPVAPT
jgi:4'-phosphopantetheinyl transferase